MRTTIQVRFLHSLPFFNRLRAQNINVMLNANICTKFGNPAPKTQQCDGQKFYSYGTLIAYVKDGKIHLTKYWDYSRTTMHYLRQALRLNTEAIKKGIKDGQFILD